MSSEPFVFSPTRAAERGLPAIGFRVVAPEALALNELAADPCGAVLRGEERRADGQLVGTVEIGLFPASLLIDRAGALRDAARAWARASLVAPARVRLLGEGDIELAGGARGYRIDLLVQLDVRGRLRPPRPYRSWFALTGEAVLTGGVSVQLCSASPTWPAAARLLDSLAIPDAAPAGARPSLPLVRPG
jgi:hypothetical protein